MRTIGVMLFLVLSVLVVGVSFLVYKYHQDGFWVVGMGNKLGVNLVSKTNLHKILSMLNAKSKSLLIISWSSKVPFYQDLQTYQPFGSNSTQPIWGCRQIKDYLGGHVQWLEVFIDTPLYRVSKGVEVDYRLNAGMAKCLENPTNSSKFSQVINLLKQGSGNYMFSLTR